MMLVYIIGNVYSHQLVKVVSVGFLYCKAIIFLFVVNKYLGGDTLRRYKSCFTNLPTHFSIRLDLICKLLLCFLLNGDSLFFSFLLHLLIGILLYGGAVPSLPFIY